MPTCFITLSHDHSATLLDTRITSVHKSPSCSRGCFNNTNSPWVSNFSVVNQLKFHFPVTAGDIHPLNGCRSIALATADGFVRLFDIRKLVSTCESTIQLVPNNKSTVITVILHLQSAYTCSVTYYIASKFSGALIY